jgi:hypothetical protein
MPLGYRETLAANELGRERLTNKEFVCTGKKVKLSAQQAVQTHRIEVLWIAHCLDNRLTDSGKVSALRPGLILLPKNIIFLLLVLLSVRG